MLSLPSSSSSSSQLLPTQPGTHQLARPQRHALRMVAC